ncbi:helix-turn-helix domain-containing protein [Spongiivirga citrea]|uniref:Helix-turn-helix domain-containing protein n=1 Tax=Spongiivirga citrea TaxID=1481457 RepID=A0A6M0CUB4_9FLAO|nr:AraC family transcriptional regulator [Spongiivirga citrea]NER19087.1 helix-turn-helix domain-containing protein [Spongiivirga citrea]
MNINLKNTAQRANNETLIDDGFVLLVIDNNQKQTQKIIREVDSSYVQFHFCLKGNSSFIFNNGRYSIELKNEHSLLLYNPQRDLPLNVDVEAKSVVVSLIMSIKKLHQLFSEEAGYISFLSGENQDKKYYQDGLIKPAMLMVLNQIVGFGLNESIKKLYYKGKAYELLSLFFNRSDESAIEACPFLVDEENVIKIRKAKDIVIARMAEPPGLQELADEIGLSLKKLKEGFKQIYGDSVYSFLFDYKMEYARKMLETGDHNVNEVGLKIGYSTASHFIAGFKKKYGTTPKKYLMSLG